ncbi:Uncharacterised protein [uncultured archaeon]|nr:Uncharacterised protein [uncultured archaeon]
MSTFQFTTRSGKEFEKPESGQYLAILADIVDLGIIKTSYNNVEKSQPMTRFVWLLEVNGKDGKPLQVQARYNNNLYSAKGKESNLYKAIKQILGTAPPVTLDPETLIGSVRKLFVIREVSEKGDFANIMGITPAEAGKTVAIPTDFVRDKNKPVEQQAKNKKPFVPGQQGQQAAAPAQTAPAPAAQDPAALIAALQAQLAAAQKAAAPTQGADVKF